MYAGASGVVASLWKVDDDATAILMKGFYEAMFKKGLSPAAALRDSQLAMARQEKWRAPYYWAGFIIQGQADTLQISRSQLFPTRQRLILAVSVAGVLVLASILGLRRRRRWLFSYNATRADLGEGAQLIPYAPISWMNKDWILTQESFDALLDWLDPAREIAGQKYEEIRWRLVKLFACRGCHEPEDLADETINRVTRKLKELAPDSAGDRVAYFYAVGNNVFKEYLRRRVREPPPPAVFESHNIEQEFACLEQLVELEVEQRERCSTTTKTKARKINQRKHWLRLGIAANALRIRAPVSVPLCKVL
jgi:DNA-directed RNA polymerase specialized sigma24 family protein